MTEIEELSTYVNARLAERAAEAAVEGGTMTGEAEALTVQVLAVKAEIFKTLPLPAWVRLGLLERLARKHLGYVKEGRDA